jgi:hypothetical protein
MRELRMDFETLMRVAAALMPPLSTTCTNARISAMS